MLRTIAYAQLEIAQMVVKEDDEVNVEATEAYERSAWPEVKDNDWCGEWKPRR